METYALFADGSASRIVFDFFTPDPKDDPVRVAFPDIEDPQVRSSARNGCLAAYRNLVRLGHIPEGRRYFPTIQYADPSANMKALGASAGLAFGLKFAQQAYWLARGVDLGFSVAATGEVSDSTGTASVTRVEGISAKLLAALRDLSSGDRLFYPLDNDSEIDPRVRTTAAELNVRLQPVSTVEQAVQDLLPKGTRSSANRNKTVLTFGAVLAVSIALWTVSRGLLTDSTNVETVTTEIRLQLARGEYENATTLAERYIQANPSGGSPIHQLLSDLNMPLGVDVAIQQSPNASPTYGDVITVDPRQGISLQPGDLYRISFDVDDSCHVYGHQTDSAGNLVVFARTPHELATPGRTYTWPPEPDRWYNLEKADGLRVTIVGTRSRLEDLERLYAAFAKAGRASEDLLQSLDESTARSLAARDAGRAGVYVQQVDLTQ